MNMNNYRYILDKSSKKFHCPLCSKRRYVRYIDSETGQHLPDQYGRCDRESNCTYHLDPYTDGYAKKVWQQENGQYNNDWIPKRRPQKAPLPKPELYPIPYEVLNETQTGYEHNVFIRNLLTRVAFPFEVHDIEKVIALYQLGTVPESGAVCFPFVDKKNQVRAIQEKIFDQHNHTDKTKQYHTTWLHSRLKYKTYRNQPLPQWLEDYEKNETKVSCLFGEHLLTKYSNNPVALVEAPKTAIYGTLYFGSPEQPQNLLWLAVYNLSSLTYHKCKVLEGRDVFLFPDLATDGKAFDLWSEKAAIFQRRLKNTYFKVSDLLEQVAPKQDRSKGNDLADYLIKHDWREYRKQSIPTHVTPKPSPEITTNDMGAEVAIVTGNESQPPIKTRRPEPSVIPFSKPKESLQRRSIKAVSNPIGRTIEAYTNHQNELLIQNPADAKRFTVYPDINSYNRRTIIPESRYRSTIDMSTLSPVIIDPKTLMIESE